MATTVVQLPAVPVTTKFEDNSTSGVAFIWLNFFETQRRVLSTVQSDLGSSQSDLSEIEADLSELQSELSTVQSELTTVQSDLSTVKATILPLTYDPTGNILRCSAEFDIYSNSGLIVEATGSGSGYLQINDNGQQGRPNPWIYSSTGIVEMYPGVNLDAYASFRTWGAGVGFECHTGGVYGTFYCDASGNIVLDQAGGTGYLNVSMVINCSNMVRSTATDVGLMCYTAGGIRPYGQFCSDGTNIWLRTSELELYCDSNLHLYSGHMLICYSADNTRYGRMYASNAAHTYLDSSTGWIMTPPGTNMQHYTNAGQNLCLRIASNDSSRFCDIYATNSGDTVIAPNGGRIAHDAQIYFFSALSRTGTNGGWGGNYWNWYWNGSLLQGYADNTAVNAACDVRIKRDIKPLEWGLDAVMKLKPVSYNFKDIPDHIFRDDGRRHLGFLGHELEEVCPWLVDRFPKDGLTIDGKIQPQGIELLSVIAVLTKALQEVSAKVDRLEARS